MSVRSATSSDFPVEVEEIDNMYPGTALQRLRSVHSRVRSLQPEQLNGDWADVRRNLLWAGGLRDLTNVPPGQGYTGHGFNDFNHCDLTTMLDEVRNAENQGNVMGVALRNPLGKSFVFFKFLFRNLLIFHFTIHMIYKYTGNGIREASLEELGPGGSWTTCMSGCHYDPPRDVAHIQFKSRIAFKLVW